MGEKEKSRRWVGFLLGFDLVEPTRRQNPDSVPCARYQIFFSKNVFINEVILPCFCLFVFPLCGYAVMIVNLLEPLSYAPVSHIYFLYYHAPSSSSCSDVTSTTFDVIPLVAFFVTLSPIYKSHSSYLDISPLGGYYYTESYLWSSLGRTTYIAHT